MRCLVKPSFDFSCCSTWHFRLCLFMFSNFFHKCCKCNQKLSFPSSSSSYYLHYQSWSQQQIFAFQFSYDFHYAFAHCKDWFLQITSHILGMYNQNFSWNISSVTGCFYFSIIHYQGLFECSLQSQPIILNSFYMEMIFLLTSSGNKFEFFLCIIFWNVVQSVN